jgi:hypothetical protein
VPEAREFARGAGRLRPLPWHPQDFRETAVALGPFRLTALLSVFLLAALSPDAADIIIRSLSDAFLQVTVFVAATLAVFYGLEVWFKIDATALLARHRAWHVPIAAALGALPGCGGAIMVITQYMRGGIGFGSVVAVLTSTMGDAAFLLLAQEPMTGLAIFTLGFFVGVGSGYVVNMIHGDDFMRYVGRPGEEAMGPCYRKVDTPAWRNLWFAFLAPGLVLGIMLAFLVDTKALFGSFLGYDTAMWIGAGGAVVSLLLWGHTVPNRVPAGSDTDTAQLGWASSSPGRLGDAPARVVGDTCFVTVWVVFAYLIYELGVHYLNIDLKTVFEVWGPIVPLMAILVGFIPGCGPQIVVASMYLGGVVPFSAELGNAISNDGDALFPAIAMAPKAAILATLYSAIPAVIVAYGYYWLFE